MQRKKMLNENKIKEDYDVLISYKAPPYVSVYVDMSALHKRDEIVKKLDEGIYGELTVVHSYDNGEILIRQYN